MAEQIVHHHPSLVDFVLESKQLGPQASLDMQEHRWDLGLGFDKACELALSGDTSLVSNASKLIDKSQAASVGIGMLKRPERCIAGGTRVDVPAYLGGSPKSMVRRTKRETVTRHVSIYVSVVSSCSIDADKLLRRGCAVLGLLELLQAMQVAVDLHLFGEFTYADDVNRPLIPVWHVESRPLDLSVAGFAIAHPAFPRDVCYSHWYHKERYGQFGGRWPRQARDSASYDTWLRKHLECDPKDIVLRGPRTAGWGAGDDELVIKSPEKWVSETLTQILTDEAA